tara:strand:- start:523 stop:1272 length:750 start_codon:yes stop_codon:yes gene_type:complete
MKSNKLIKYKKITHNFFNKTGGTSTGIYKSLNCGIGSKDKKSSILKNIKFVTKKIGCKNDKLILMNQVHSSKIIEVKKSFKKKIIGDGLFTSKPGLALGILTADCAPILMYDKKLEFIGAAHAGWKGAYKGVALKLASYFVKKGSKKKNLIVVIGPCIKKNSYEVKSNFKRKFLLKNKKNFRFFTKKNEKIYFDLPNFIKFQLIEFGVKNIEIINKDTFKRGNNFFSARYSISKKYDDYGRNISIIMIK